MRAVLRDLLRARAQARHRHHDAHPHFGLAVMALADEGRLVVHEALDTGDGSLLHDEERKAHLDVTGVGLEPVGHLFQHRAK